MNSQLTERTLLLSGTTSRALGSSISAIWPRGLISSMMDAKCWFVFVSEATYHGEIPRAFISSSRGLRWLTI